MSDQGKRNRDLELLKGAVERSRNTGPQQEEEAPATRQGIMYRGQPVNGRGGGGGAPGAPSRRGSGGSRPTSSSSGGSADVKEALSKLTNLFNDGLITQSEYDAKRAEILDRI